MPAGANRKQERQYEHIKRGAERRGSSEGRAEEIAARTVNKNRAQQGQAKQRSATSVHDISPQRRGGLRSGNRTGPLGRTKAQLYEDARRAGVDGRSKMNKAELEKALARG
ncbi:plasmid stabilization protein [Saccharopolyspora sp. NPDC047091]|uniref:plasmid stabilization protein n=1 Tax=Saccharopolyspora sp. NPDC047091 TaxID=3155924 RepID=UPI0033E5D97C